MDDTAQNPQQDQQMQPSVPQVPQQPVAPVVAQPPMTGGRPEAPMSAGLPPREAAPIANAEAGAQTASDDQAAMPDEVADASNVQTKEAADIQIHEAHPQVEIARELQEAGVEQGKDAEPSQREEEQLKTEQVAHPSSEDLRPDTQSAASGISLASDPLQLEEVKKKSGIREAIKWLATSLIRQLKKMNMKPEDQKSTW